MSEPFRYEISGELAQMKPATRIIFVVTEDWYFVLHWLPLALAARDAGYAVTVITRCRQHLEAIKQTGLPVIAFDMSRKSLNPLSLLRETIGLAGIYSRCEPDIIHHIALRPVFAGGLAARITGKRRVVSTITGMGYLFTGQGRPGVARRILEKILPCVLVNGIITVQNQDDAEQLYDLGVASSQVRLIPGVGIDTGLYTPISEASGRRTVLLAARMLRDKGIEEFVEAARRLQNSGAHFVLVGALDSGNPSAITEDIIQSWQQEGVVQWWGHRTDMAAVLQSAYLVCLPSYREGLPTVLLEAMACGKACVATNVPGCREAIHHEDNGLLVPAKDAAALAAAISWLLDNPEECRKMGARGRQRAVEEFSREQVIKATLAVYQEVMR